MLILFLACMSLPLDEGTYNLRIDSQENSCGLRDTAYNVGEILSADLTWPDEQTLQLDMGYIIAYSYLGDFTFTGSTTLDQELDTRCTLHTDVSDQGLITDTWAFHIREDAAYSLVGPCTNWDTSDFPCAATLQMSGVQAAE